MQNFTTTRSNWQKYIVYTVVCKHSVSASYITRAVSHKIRRQIMLKNPKWSDGWM